MIHYMNQICKITILQIAHLTSDIIQANIVIELDKLCNHLPHSLTEQCTDFVKTYSKELVEMLLADLTPQEVCSYLKLCNSTKDPSPKKSIDYQRNIRKDHEICESS